MKNKKEQKRHVHVTPEEALQWPIVDCTVCGKAYAREVPFKRRCLPCFKESQDYELLRGDLMVLALQVEIERLRKEIMRLREDETKAVATVEHEPLITQLISLLKGEHLLNKLDLDPKSPNIEAETERTYSQVDILAMLEAHR